MGGSARAATPPIGCCGERAAATCTLIETAKLNGVDLQAWSADVLARIAGRPAKRIADLLPWTWRAERLAAAVEPQASCRPDDASEAPAGEDLMPAHDHPLLGKWRIVEMELWDSDFLDLVEPAYITFDQQGGGEFVFGAVQGSLHCRYRPASVRFTWQGFNEMDPASGASDAELDDDGLLTGEIRFHDGDDSTFKARRW